MTTNTLPASEKQMTWIVKLVDEKAISAELRAEIKDGIHAGFISKANATKYLDVLFAKTTPNIPVAGAITEVGFYLHEGKVYKVVQAKMTKNLYAKLVTADGFDFEAAKGMMKTLRADMKMTVEDIVTHGLSTGVCCNCSALLSDPISQFIGLGTKCGPDLMGKESYNAAKKAAKADPKTAAAIAAKEALKATGSPVVPVPDQELTLSF